MNLGELRDGVQSELQHAPTTTNWKNDVAKVINENLSLTLSMERWSFRVVETHLRALKDREGVTVSIDAVGAGAPVLLRPVAGVPTVYYEDYDSLVLVASDTEDSLRRFGRISGGTTGFPRKWRQCFDRDDGYYLNGSPDPDISTSSSVTLYFDEPPAATWTGAGGGAPPATYTDAILRHDRYRLPYDCADIISIVSRDQNKRELTLVNRTRERSLLLNGDQDAPGDPQAWLLDDAITAGPAPRKTLVGAASPGGFLAANTTYRYFYAFWWKGCYSGRSNIVSVTTTGVNLTIDLSNMEDEPVNRYGRTKHVFRDDGDGRFRWVAQVSSTGTTSSNSTVSSADETWVWDDRMTAPQMAIRLYPRPSVDQWLYVQYVRVPNQLQCDTDVPEMPHEFHPLLVHQSVAQLAARFKQPDLIGFHTQKANEYLGRMKGQYVVRSLPGKMGSWGGPGGGRRWFPTNPASIS